MCRGGQIWKRSQHMTHPFHSESHSTRERNWKHKIHRLKVQCFITRLQTEYTFVWRVVRCSIVLPVWWVASLSTLNMWMLCIYIYTVLHTDELLGEMSNQKSYTKWNVDSKVVRNLKRKKRNRDPKKEARVFMMCIHNIIYIYIYTYYICMRVCVYMLKQVYWFIVLRDALRNSKYTIGWTCCANPMVGILGDFSWPHDPTSP